MLKEVIRRYLELFPDEKEGLKLLLEQIDKEDKLDGRDNFTGHVTGTAIILSPDLRKILLIYHPAMKRWQPPGGHWDEGEEGPWLAAEREAQEETGVKIKQRLNLSKDIRIPLQIDSQLVPKRPPKNEPEHYHHDFRYGFLAASEGLNLADNVIKEAQWKNYNQLKQESSREAFKRLEHLLKLKG